MNTDPKNWRQPVYLHSFHRKASSSARVGNGMMRTCPMEVDSGRGDLPGSSSWGPAPGGEIKTRSASLHTHTKAAQPAVFRSWHNLIRLRFRRRRQIPTRSGYRKKTKYSRARFGILHRLQQFPRVFLAVWLSKKRDSYLS